MLHQRSVYRVWSTQPQQPVWGYRAKTVERTSAQFGCINRSAVSETREVKAFFPCWVLQSMAEALAQRMSEL